jgi:hypothetical protein
MALATAAGYAIEAARQPDRALALGHDFLPGYVAGQLVRLGQYQQLYDSAAFQAAERRVMDEANLAGDPRLAPWVNPPFFALPFAPLSALPYRAALGVYFAINLSLLAVSLVLLCRMLPAGGGWRAWGPAPLLVVGSVPFWQVMTHQQSTFLSLALLCTAVTLWRSGRPGWAGVAAGLLLYKPQLATAVAAALVVVAGRRALAGLVVTGFSLLLAGELAMPGTLAAFARGAPPIVRHLQTAYAYNWGRQVTLHSLWRLLLQGHAAGETGGVVRAVWLATWLAVAAPLGVAAWRAVRGASAAGRERLVAAAVVCMPLLMPYYMDYDLLLLAVPAVLFAADLMRRDAARPLPRADRWLLAAWPALYVWMLLNADVAERTRVNVAVPLIVTVASLMIARVRGRAVAPKAEERPAPVLAKAA